MYLNLIEIAGFKYKQNKIIKYDQKNTKKKEEYYTTQCKKVKIYEQTCFMIY